MIEPLILTAVSGLIAASVGIASAWLQFKLNVQLIRDNERARRHEVWQEIHGRVRDAARTIWIISYKVERDSNVTEAEIEEYVAATMWLPEEVRVLALQVLEQSQKSANDLTTQTAAGALRQAISLVTGVDEWNAAFKRLSKGDSG